MLNFDLIENIILWWLQLHTLRRQIADIETEKQNRIF